MPMDGIVLRAGLGIDSWHVNRWAAELIDCLCRHPLVEINWVAIIEDDPPQATSAPSGLYAWQQHWDTHRASRLLEAQGPVDVRERLAGIPPFMPDAPTAMARPDLFLWLGESPVTQAMLDLPLHGVWWHRHGQRERYARAVGFEEVASGQTASETLLLAFTGQTRQAVIIGRAYSRTHPNSPALNRLGMQLAGARLVPDVLEKLSDLSLPLEALHAQGELMVLPEPSRSPTPGNTSVAWALFRWFANRAVRLLAKGRRTSGQWTVGVMHNRDWPHTAAQPPLIDWYAPRNDHFLADPFGVERDGMLFLFVEELDRHTQRGHISVLPWTAEQGFGPLSTVLKEDVHLSFPFFFEWEGQLWMMPERGNGGDVRAYPSITFPHQWGTPRVVMPGMSAVDAVLVQHQGLWWLFLTRGSLDACEDNLFAFHGPSPFGPWTPHAGNPVKTGLRGSRMAGAFQQREGKLLRPAQNCERRYGGSLVLWEVQELTPTTYRETEVRELTADKAFGVWNQGVHTLNETASCTVVDGLRDVAG